MTCINCGISYEAKSKNAKRCRPCAVDRRKKLQKERSASWYEMNKEKHKVMNLQNYKKNKFRYLEQARERAYGINNETYDVMLKNQDNKCAICFTKQTELSYPLHIDHDHKNGVVRGLLCRPCNTAIGLLKENPEILSAAMLYLGSKNV